MRAPRCRRVHASVRGVPPAGSTPASLRLAPDGRTLALAAGGGALAAYEVPAPKPRRSSARLRRRRRRATRASEARVATWTRAATRARERARTIPTIPTIPTEKRPFPEAEEGTPSLGVAQTHEDAAFAAATPLVWLAAARAADAFGRRRSPRRRARTPRARVTRTSPPETRKGRRTRSPARARKTPRSRKKVAPRRETRRRKRKRSRLPTFAPARPTCISAWTPPGAPTRFSRRGPGVTAPRCSPRAARWTRSRWPRTDTRRALAPRRARSGGGGAGGR